MIIFATIVSRCVCCYRSRKPSLLRMRIRQYVRIISKNNWKQK